MGIRWAGADGADGGCGGADVSGGCGDGMTLLNARRAYHGHINYSIKGVKKSLKYLCVTPLSK